MPYTFKPKEKHAKARSLLYISPRNALIICRVINKKKLTMAKRLLEDIVSQRRSLRGKYYTSASTAILKLLESCEKNAENLGLEVGKLFVYASTCYGPKMRRKRRKSDFGTEMKASYVELILVEKGRESGVRKLAKSESKKEEKAEVKDEKKSEKNE